METEWEQFRDKGSPISKGGGGGENVSTRSISTYFYIHSFRLENEIYNICFFDGQKSDGQARSGYKHQTEDSNHY